MLNLQISKKIFNETYYPYLLDYSKRINVYYGGAGSGKSHFVATKLIIKCLNQPRKLLVVRKYATTIKNSVFTLFCDILKQFKIYSMCKINLSTYTITLPNGSVILMIGLSDSEKIKSIAGITDIFIEECTECSLDDYTQLDLRLRAKAPNQQIYLCLNPTSKASWVYKLFFEDPSAVGDDVFILKTTYKDNRFLPPEYIKALKDKERTNPTYYKIYALGEFCSLEKLVLTNWRVEEFDVLELAKSGLEHRAGMDMGYVDDTAIADIMYDKDNHRIYIFNEFCKPGCQFDEIADKLKEMNLTKIPVWTDCADPRAIAYFRQEGINAQPSKKGTNSVEVGFSFLQNLEIIVHPKCGKFKTDLENFSYIKNKDGEYDGRMGPHEFSHTLDALRYSVADIYTQRKIKTFDKSLLGL